MEGFIHMLRNLNCTFWNKYIPLTEVEAEIEGGKIGARKLGKR